MRESASTDLREPQGSNPLGPPGPELTPEALSGSQVDSPCSCRAIFEIGPGSDATVSDLQAFRGYAAEVMGCCGASFWAESELGDAPGKEASS